MKLFINRSLKLLGLGRQFGQIILSHFGYFQSIYQDPFWYCESMFFIHQQVIFTKNSAFISKSKILICKWDLNLGRDELGIQPSCVRSPCVRVHESWPKFVIIFLPVPFCALRPFKKYLCRQNTGHALEIWICRCSLFYRRELRASKSAGANSI